MASDDLETRIALLEQQGELTSLRIEAKVRGHVEGQISGAVNSLSNDVNATREELRGEIGALRRVVHGQHGDNGMRSQIRWLVWAQRIQWVAIAGLVAYTTGVRLPPMLP